MPSNDPGQAELPDIEPPWPALPGGREPITITNVTTVCTAPEGVRLVLVKVQTSDAGLHGWGCATFTQRPLAVITAVEQYLRPFLIGRNPDDIEDIWQAASLSSYWRSGPVLNNALAGVDMALWDIKGKRAGMPVHQLFGGRTRRAADVYVHANGRDLNDLTEQVRRYLDLGFRHVRCQVDIPGYSTYGKGSGDHRAGIPANPPVRQDPWESRPYGRDSDSIATMAGAIAGALYGMAAIPGTWAAAVAEGSRIDLTATGRTMADVAREVFDRDQRRLQAHADAMAQLREQRGPELGSAAAKAV